ncbi:MAG: hypothetical protein JSV27_08435 [Candidatus Bathyarchaeota archaeon]|nr:MAG: hypothetical protein JSV27_08435 [Candidatus Bathyarchaeota archaeon]
MISKVEKVLTFLASRERDNRGDAWTAGTEIEEETTLPAADINDVIDITEKRGFVQTRTSMATRPFKFNDVSITAEGRLWLDSKERLIEDTI